MSKAAELAALIGSQTALSNRNLVINGAMQVAQRGTSATNPGGFTTLLTVGGLVRTAADWVILPQRSLQMFLPARDLVHLLK